MGFVILLLRRFGLAIGAWLVTYHLCWYLSLSFSIRINGSAPSLFEPHEKAIAWGMAILVFFLPRPGFGKPKAKDDQ